MIENQKLLNAKEAAEFLCLSPKTLAKWRSDGKYGPSYLMLGGGGNRRGRVVYKVEDLISWAESCRVFINAV